MTVSAQPALPARPDLILFTGVSEVKRMLPDFRRFGRNGVA